MKHYIFIIVALFASIALKAQSDGNRAGADTLSANVETSRHDTPVASNILWDKANTAYVNEDYHTAMDIYNDIMAKGLHSDKLYYNLANAYFKQGNTGKAILFYNRALRMHPGSDDIRYNLQIAENMTKDKIDAVPEFFVRTWLRSVRNTMGCTAWSIISLTTLTLMLASVLAYLLAKRMTLRKTGFYVMLAMLAVFIATTSFAITERREMLDRTAAIVMGSSVSVKSSPAGSATDLFVLHEGTKVRIIDRMDSWSEITIADGKKGWIESSKIEVI